jgi:hypothetical protein
MSSWRMRHEMLSPVSASMGNFGIGLQLCTHWMGVMPNLSQAVAAKLQ